jgi:uncharacterized protein YukE
MSQAIVNPADLRRFANNLKMFCGELQTQSSQLRAQMGSLGNTWRDQEHEKFMAEFEQTMLVINRFLEASSQHIPFLLRKAERVEEYLQQR